MFVFVLGRSWLKPMTDRQWGLLAGLIAAFPIGVLRASLRGTVGTRGEKDPHGDPLRLVAYRRYRPVDFDGLDAIVTGGFAVVHLALTDDFTVGRLENKERFTCGKPLLTKTLRIEPSTVSKYPSFYP